MNATIIIWTIIIPPIHMIFMQPLQICTWQWKPGALPLGMVDLDDLHSNLPTLPVICNINYISMHHSMDIH
jgi:hypothetical protein